MVSVMITPVQSPALLALPGIRHAFFTRQGGVSEGPIYGSLNGGMGSGDDKAKVTENRRRMAAFLDIQPESLVSVWQVHSPDCLHVTAPWTGERPKADAMATATGGLALGVATADCGPVLFADPAAGVVGAAHAGWKGAIGGVIEATLLRMEELGAKRKNVTAVLGPMLSQWNYEVGPEFVARFVAENTGNARFFIPSAKAGHAMFDLPGYNMERLQQAGVGQAESLALCTYADEERFYSYRRTTHRSEPDYGRLISAICLA
jgi:polyphenol oxidase